MEYSKFIRFLNPNDTCAPGEVLKGEVVLTLEKTRKFKGINVLITGQADTEWKEREKKEVNGSTKKITETYKGRKVYFEQMLPLVGALTNQEFNTGTHTFPFAYHLSETLPPSIKGTHGNCTYTVKAIFDRPWRPNETIKKEFEVATKYLYSVAQLSPLYDEAVEEIRMLSFRTAPFKLNMEVAQQAFQIGDGIPVSVTIEHDSNITIHELKFQLRQVLNFFSQRPTRKTKTEYNKIVEIRCKVMDSRKLIKFQRVLQIPHLPATYSTYSELASIAYEVRVTVKLGGLNKNPVVQLPIVIGTGFNSEQAAIGFENMAMSPQPSLLASSMMRLNVSPCSPAAGSSPGFNATTTTQASLEAMMRRESTTSWGREQDQATAPPAYNDVVPAAAEMMKQ